MEGQTSLKKLFFKDEWMSYGLEKWQNSNFQINFPFKCQMANHACICIVYMLSLKDVLLLLGRRWTHSFSHYIRQRWAMEISEEARERELSRNLKKGNNWGLSDEKLHLINVSISTIVFAILLICFLFKQEVGEEHIEDFKISHNWKKKITKGYFKLLQKLKKNFYQYIST